MELEGCYRCARKLGEVPSYRLFVEMVEFAGTDGESVRLGPLEAVQDSRFVDIVFGPCKMKYLGISAERRKVGGV